VKSGETPIMLRITIAGQLAEIQLKRTVKATQWNQKKERCTGKDAASFEISRYLESVKLRLFDIHRTMEHNDKCRELIGKDDAKVTVSRSDTCLK